jgi:hypothetical protein
MRKTLLCALVLLIAGVCLRAQESGQTMGKSSPTSIQGCLQYSKHHYVLTDSSGTGHQLSGYANKLKPHVGHEVEVTGTEGVRTVGTTTEGTASSAKQIPVFHVSGVKHIADTCK